MLIAKVKRHHREIVRRTEIVTDVSSDGVLSIGHALAEVMQGALAIERRITALRSDEQPVVFDSNDLRDALLSPLAESGRLTESAATIVSRVGHACDELTHITSMCQILLMHTRIETDRMRETGIVATSEQLSSFTSQIVAATNQAESVQQDLAHLVDDLDRALPALRKVLETLHQGVRTRQFRQQQQQAISGERMGNAIARIRAGAKNIVALSQDGVTALQFHDPACQALQRLDSKLTELVLEHLGEDEPLRWQRRLGDSEPNVLGDEADALRAGAHFLKEHVHRRADGFTQEADHAVLVLREIIPALVSLVEGQVAASEEAVQHARMTDEITPFLNRSVAELDRLTRGYASVASNGHALCKRIVEVQQTIASVAHRVEAPAQNLSLQASKAGKHGRPLAVIAEEVVAMSRRTAQVGQRVVDSANALLELLPQLQERAGFIAEQVHARASVIRTSLADVVRHSSERTSDLRDALSEVQQLARRVREAERSAHAHYGFAEQLRPVLESMKVTADTLYQDVIAALGDARGDRTPDGDYAADSGRQHHWMLESESAASVEHGELILL